MRRSRCPGRWRSRRARLPPGRAGLPQHPACRRRRPANWRGRRGRPSHQLPRAHRRRTHRATCPPVDVSAGVPGGTGHQRETTPACLVCGQPGRSSCDVARPRRGCSPGSTLREHHRRAAHLRGASRPVRRVSLLSGATPGSPACGRAHPALNPGGAFVTAPGRGGRCASRKACCVVSCACDGSRTTVASSRKPAPASATITASTECRW